MSNRSIGFRRLRSSDVTCMRDMLAMFGDAFEDPATYTTSSPTDAYLEDLLASDTFIAIAATDAGRVVGGLAAYVLRKFERARCEIYIYDLAVAASHRRQGIATGMIRRLQRIGADLGAHVLFVQADHVDEPAVALYTKLGVREDVLHFDIGVEPPA